MRNRWDKVFSLQVYQTRLFKSQFLTSKMWNYKWTCHVGFNLLELPWLGNNRRQEAQKRLERSHLIETKIFQPGKSFLATTCSLGQRKFKKINISNNNKNILCTLHETAFTRIGLDWKFILIFVGAFYVSPTQVFFPMPIYSLIAVCWYKI